MSYGLARRKFRIDGRLKKSEYYSIYGGNFDVADVADVPGSMAMNANGERKQIKWRRWRACAG